MKFELEVYKEIDFLFRLLTSNPYTAEGKSILNGLEINLSVEDFFEKDVFYAKPFFVNETNGRTNHSEDTDEEDSSDKEDYIFVSD